STAPFQAVPTGESSTGRQAHLQAVDGVDLAVARGETLGIVGESGCGKSTLGRLLLGLTKADQGVIEWNGRPIGRHDGRVQAVFQDPSSAFNPRQRVKSAIAEALPAAKRSRAAQYVAELLHLVGLGEEFLRRRPMNSPEASCNEWVSPGRSPPIRCSFSWTKRSAHWTPHCRCRWWTCSGTFSTGPGRPTCSFPTTYAPYGPSATGSP